MSMKVVRFHMASSRLFYICLYVICPSSLPKHITIRLKNILSLQCFVVSQMGSRSGVACAHLYIVFWWMHILTSPRLLLSISLNICEHNKQANSMTYITPIAQPKCILFSKKSFHWKPRTHPTIHYGYTYSQYLEPNWTELNWTQSSGI